jgi:hypothetical protein
MTPIIMTYDTYLLCHIRPLSTLLLRCQAHDRHQVRPQALGPRLRRRDDRMPQLHGPPRYVSQ